MFFYQWFLGANKQICRTKRNDELCFEERQFGRNFLASELRFREDDRSRSLPLIYGLVRNSAAPAPPNQEERADWTGALGERESNGSNMLKWHWPIKFWVLFPKNTGACCVKGLGMRSGVALFSPCAECRQEGQIPTPAFLRANTRSFRPEGNT